MSNRSHRDRRPSEKIVANRKFFLLSLFSPFILRSHSLGTTQEEAARRQQLLDANRAERAKRAERKANKAAGIDRPAHSDDENRDIGSVKKKSSHVNNSA